MNQKYSRISKIKRGLAIACLMAAAVGLLGGCRSMKSKEAEENYREKGIHAMSEGKYEDAAGYFQKALDQSLGGIHDTEVDICLYKAEALYLSGDTEGALDTYTALIEYKERADVYYLRGNVYFAQGDQKDGLADFAAAVEKDDDNYELYIGIYNTLTKFGKGTEAEDYLTRALAIEGNKASDLMEQGRIHYLLGDMQEAIDTLNSAVEKGSQEANFYLAQVYTAIGDTEEADACFQTYMESGIADASNLLEIGENNMNTGNYEEALRYFTSAEALGTLNEDNQQRLMRDTIIAYEYTGDFDAAFDLIEEYAEEYPDDYEAEKEETFLKTRDSDAVPVNRAETETETESEAQ